MESPSENLNEINEESGKNVMSNKKVICDDTKKDKDQTTIDMTSLQQAVTADEIVDADRKTRVIKLKEVELKQSKNPWVRIRFQDQVELSVAEKEKIGLRRNVQSILNKLTPQKFKTLAGDMINLRIDSVEKLELISALVFEKSISEPLYCAAYAKLCRVLTNDLKSVPGNTHFRMLLLNRCQKEFEEEYEKNICLKELNDKDLKNRRRTLGNIQFLGELFKLKMVSEKIMHECIFKLMCANNPKAIDANLECLCKLLCTTGKDLDHAEAKPRMDQYFVQITKIIEKKKISSRIKFALKDVIELRSSNWVPRRHVEIPDTIDELNRQAQHKEEMYKQVSNPQKQRSMQPDRSFESSDPSINAWTKTITHDKEIK